MESDSLQCDLMWEADQPQPGELDPEVFIEDLGRLLELGASEVSILITNDERMHELNKQYRGIDRTTDVLSFPQAGPVIDEMERHLGDIVISYQQAARQAESIGHSISREIRFLILHGMLHLLGYDHETDDGEMLRRQSELKTRLARYF